MIRSYDFLIRAYRDPTFRDEITQHINLSNDSEMIFDYAVLKFDSNHRIISEYPNIGVLLANKIIPMELSYDAFYEIMNSEKPWVICGQVCKFLE